MAKKTNSKNENGLELVGKGYNLIVNELKNVMLSDDDSNIDIYYLTIGVILSIFAIRGKNIILNKIKGEC